MPQTNFKNKKYYTVSDETGNCVGYSSKDINFSKKHLDNDYPYLLELTVTKVYTRETDLKEIEL